MIIITRYLQSSFFYFLIAVEAGFLKLNQNGKHHEGCGPWDSKVVKVAQGTMKGLTMYTDSGQPFCSFRGIPFSQPPVGEYRFKSSRVPKPWKGVLDATSESPQCIMYAPIIGSFGVEDCLYLSVFTPTLKPGNGTLLDVMVWIYPGEYSEGISFSIMFGPHLFIEKDIIVVLVNYRLGVLGFLSTGDDESPGNYGMKDQSAGIRWVKNNIAAFGGNPNSITIFGVSSGASSTHLQMLSPLSRGLFHRVISMGGTAVNPWTRARDPIPLARKQARVVGCPTDSNSKLVSCLREIDARTLVSTLKYMFLWFLGPGPGFAPVVEKKTERNPDPFMTEDPLDVMRKGNFEPVPWLMGGNAQGSAFAVVLLVRILVMRNQLNRLFATNFLPKLLMMDVSVPPHLLVNVTNRMADFYMGSDHKLSEEKIGQIMNMFTDRFLVHGHYKAAQLHSLVGNQTIYKYNFAYRSFISDSMGADLRNYGASHGDEMQYIFEPAYGIMRGKGDPTEVQDMFIAFFTNFAKHGNPTPGIPSGNYLVDEFEWLPVGQTNPDNMHLRYLNIGQVKYPGVPSDYLNEGLGAVTLQMAADLHKERMNFMDSLPLNENCLRSCNE